MPSVGSGVIARLVMLFRPVRMIIPSSLSWICFAVLLGSLLLVTVPSSSSAGGFNVVKDGTVELEVEADLNAQALFLRGEWRFAWGELVELDTWERLTQEMPILISVPSKWDNLQVTSEMKGKALSGYATYALRVRWRGDYNLALHFDDVESAARVFVSVDGIALDRIYERGKVAAQPSDEIPLNFSSLSVPLVLPNLAGDAEQLHEAIVVLQVSSHHHPRGGVWGVPEVMLLERSTRIRDLRMVQSAMMLGILVIIGIYHLVLTVRRTGSRSAFLFGLFCMSVSGQELVNSGFLPHFGIGRSITGFEWLVKLEYLVMPAMVVSCAYFIAALVPGTILQFALRFFVLPSSSMLVLGTLLTSPMVFASYLRWYENQALVVILIVFVHLLRADHELRRWIFLAFGVIALGAVNDILYTDNMVQTGYILPYTMIVFVLMQSWLVARNFELARVDREHYYQRLLATYQQLEKELENRASLQAENRELQEKNFTAIEDLINAEKLASMGTMAAGVAHDIINPLAVVQTVRDLTRDTLLSATDELNNLRESGQNELTISRVTELIETLEANESHRELAISKVTEIVTAMRRHVTTQVDSEVTLLRDLIDECLLLVRHKVEHCDVQVSCDAMARIDVKRAQFGQVLMNLIVNAGEELREAGEERGKEFKPMIRLMAIVKGDAFAIIVEDNGRGFQQAASSLGQKPFYTTKSASGGTGLGLTIVKHIADGHALELKGGVSAALGGAQVIIHTQDFDFSAYPGIFETQANA